MNKFDEFFKSELENHELTPPKNAWSGIQSKLDSKRPIALLWYAKRVGIAAAILLGGYLTFDSLSSSFINSKKHKQEMNEWSRAEEAKSNAINGESSSSAPIQNGTVSSGDVGQGSSKSHDSNTTGRSPHSQKSKSGSLIEGVNAHVGGSALVRNKEESFNKNGSQTDHNQPGIGSSRLTDDWFYPNFKTKRSSGKRKERVANNTAKSQKGASFGNQGAAKKDAGYKYSANDNSTQDKVQIYSGNSNIGVDEWAIQANSLGLDFFSANAVYPIFPTELPDDLSLDIYEEWAKNQNTNDDEEKQSTLKKMDVYAYTSPTRFDALSGISLPELGGLEQSASNNLAFGFRAGYALNDRWKIRSGIGMMRISQTTEDVPLTNNFFSAAIPQLGGIIAAPQGSINYISSLQMNMGSTNVAPNEINALAVNDFRGDLIQNIAYVEIPLEVEYKVIKKKRYDISATAGASTFVLTDNDITADIEGDNFAVGEANNLNSTSVSANVGVRFDVNVKKNIDFTVEPHFKYLMNSVNNNPDFRPYVTGINAGIRIKL